MNLKHLLRAVILFGLPAASSPGQEIGLRPIQQAFDAAREQVQIPLLTQDEQLILAAEKGDMPRVQELIRKGANIHARDIFNHTPLIGAAAAGSAEIVQLLLDKGADPNAQAAGFTWIGDTPLIAAVMYRHRTVAEILIKCRANVNAKDAVKKSALHWAAQYGFGDMVGLLLINGADINARGHEGWTALINAAHDRHADIVVFLAKKGADVNARGDDGFPTLFRAIYHEDTPVVRALVDNKADVNVKDKFGITPIMVAAFVGSVDILQVLLENGADPAMVSKRGETALKFAEEKGHEPAARMIREALSKKRTI